MGLWMGLNHMNGRVEDAVTGRWLSADPAVPYPINSQSYNRYSYAVDNPLSYLDPSGFDECVPNDSAGIGNIGEGSDDTGQAGSMNEDQCTGNDPNTVPPDESVPTCQDVGPDGLCEVTVCGNCHQPFAPPPPIDAIPIFFPQIIQAPSSAALARPANPRLDFVTCMASATSIGRIENTESSTLTNLNLSNAGVDAGTSMLLNSSDTQLGRVLGFPAGLPAPTNALSAQLGADVRAALDAGTPLIKLGGAGIGAATTIYSGVSAYQNGGTPGTIAAQAALAQPTLQLNMDSPRWGLRASPAPSASIAWVAIGHWGRALRWELQCNNASSKVECSHPP